MHGPSGYGADMTRRFTFITTYAAVTFMCACAPRADHGAVDDDDAEPDTDTATDTGVSAGVPTIHVEGTVAGEPYTFDCNAEAASRAYSTFPDGATWFVSLSCDGEDGNDWVDVVATDAEVGRVYGAQDAASFNAFLVVLDNGAKRFDYSDPIAYALTFTTASYEEGVGVTLAGSFSGTWTDAEFAGEFEGYAPCASGCDG